MVKFALATPTATIPALREAKSCQDAQHQYMAIAQQALPQPVLHVVAAIAAIDHIRLRPTPRLTLHQGATGATVVALAGAAVVQSHGGREQALLWCTRVLRFGRLHQFATISKNERL